MDFGDIALGGGIEDIEMAEPQYDGVGDALESAAFDGDCAIAFALDHFVEIGEPILST